MSIRTLVTTTIDDSAVILAPEAFTVYRSPQAYMSVNVVSNLQVQVAIYGYMATIAKMPNGIVNLTLTKTLIVGRALALCPTDPM
jgi:hypothetical protein